MVGIGKTLFREAEAKKLHDAGFLKPKFGNRSKTSGCSGNRQTGTDTAPSLAPAYLKLPSLNSVQKIICQSHDIRTPCRILSALNGIFPLDRFSSDRNDPVSLLTHCLQKWLESFMPSDVLDKLNLELEICPAADADRELFDELLEEEYLFRFGIGCFVNRYFPLAEVIAQYNKLDPMLGKYVLKLLSDCPLSIGTPEMIYECISFFCWCGENDDAEIYQEHYQECLDGGYDEEEAREVARETVIMEYGKLEVNFPEWSFKRDQRIREYRGIIPDELKKMEYHRKKYRRMKKVTSMYPSVWYPGIIAPLDQRGFDFSCEAINRISDNQIQSGGNYTLSSLGWSFLPSGRKQMVQMFREIQTTLEYFGACIEFLLNHEMEYANA